MKRQILQIDNIVAVTILIIDIPLIILSYTLQHPGVLPMLTAILVAPIIYLLFRNKLVRDVMPIADHFSISIRIMIHILFVISLSLSIWILLQSQYNRPYIYFICVLIAGLSIVFDIFSVDQNKKGHIAIVLLKIIFLSLSIYAGIYFQFSGFYGVDPWIHNIIIQELIQLGHIPNVGLLNYPNDYALFPVYHIIGALTQLITNVDIRAAVFASIVIMMSVSCIFIYSIGTRLTTPRIGLLATLIFSLYSYTIVMSAAVIPMSLGFCFYIGILFLILSRDRFNVSDTIIIIILSLAIIFTHTIAAFITLLSLITIYVGFKIHHRLEYLSNNHDSVKMSLIAMFSVAMFAIWVQVTSSTSSFFDLVLNRLTNNIQSQAQFKLATPVISSGIPLEISILDQGSYLILLVFALVGVLVFLHPALRGKNRTVLVFIWSMLLIIPYSFQIASLNDIIPERWMLFFCIPLSILAIFGLYKTASLITSRIFRMTFIFIIISGVIWMGITNSAANNDSPLVLNGSIRIGYTTSELAAVNTLSSIGAGYPITDIYYSYTLPSILTSEEYYNMTTNKRPVFILRNYYLTHPEWNKRYMVALRKCIANNEFVITEPLNVSEYIKSEKIDAWPLIYSSDNIKVYSSLNEIVP
jgi:hypothetical protein